jgi:hypothetical protein
MCCHNEDEHKHEHTHEAASHRHDGHEHSHEAIPLTPMNMPTAISFSETSG